MPEALAPRGCAPLAGLIANAVLGAPSTRTALAHTVDGRRSTWERGRRADRRNGFTRRASAGARAGGGLPGGRARAVGHTRTHTDGSTLGATHDHAGRYAPRHPAAVCAGLRDGVSWGTVRARWRPDRDISSPRSAQLHAGWRPRTWRRPVHRAAGVRRALWAERPTVGTILLGLVLGFE